MKKSAKKSTCNHYHSKILSANHRRALSTVVSSAIIMSAVSIMGVMLVGWSNSNLFTQQANIESSFNEKMNKLNEDLMIENIWFGTNPNIVNVTLNNVGYIGLNITAIKIVNSTATLSISITDGGIAPSNDYSFQRQFDWTAGEPTDFTITTNRGNYFTSQEVT
ncbi:MAG: hypothetical protein CO032_06665 [Nitrosopumilales archaeon CG_4_9_14_0_2_um_filter_34_16]|nr:MAG: hypothetical protein CO032_06665 [Nitrosopumilales archaeon CG_4_9_14_0_2_um_filter_34_16]